MNNKNFFNFNLKSKVFWINSSLILIAFFLIFSPGNYFENSELKNNYQYKNIENEKNDFLEEGKSYEIDSILDGDTIKIIYKNGKKISVRMIGLDTPESYNTRFGYSGCFGVEAKNYLKNLIGNSEFVEIEIDKSQGEFDKYDRLLAYVFLNGENLNQKMIKDGYGWEFTYKTKYKYQEDFKNAEKFADENDFGLWAKETCNGKRVKIKE